MMEGTDAGALRSRLLKYEAAILALGWWFYVMGLLFVLMGLGLVNLGTFFVMELWNRTDVEEWMMVVVTYGMGVVALLVGGLGIYSAWGIRDFTPASRGPALLTAMLLLTNIPMGLIAGVSGLYLLMHPNAKEAFTKRYQDARLATVSTEPPTHPLLWGLGVCAVLFVLVPAVLSTVFAYRILFGPGSML